MKIFKGILVVFVLLIAVAMLNASGSSVKNTNNNVKKETDKKVFEENNKISKRRLNEIIKDIEIKQKKLRKAMEKDPNKAFYISAITWTSRPMVLEYSEDLGKEVVKRTKMIQFLEEIMKKTQKPEIINKCIDWLEAYAKYLGFKKEIIPIIKKELNSKFIDVRLYAANQLVKIDKKYKKDVYHVYVDILTMKEKKLKKILENRPLPYAYKEDLKSIKNIKDSKKIKEINLSVELWRIDPIITCLGKLVKNYNDNETKAILQKCIKNNYISSLINRYDELMEESLKISKKNKNQRVKRKKFSTILNKDINNMGR